MKKIIEDENGEKGYKKEGKKMKNESNLKKKKK